MKTILVAMVLALGTQAHAEFTGPDAIYTIIKCERAVTVPDLGLSLEVEQGGIAGLTSIRVDEFFIGHNHSAKTYVRQMPIPSKRLGAPMVYEGQDIRLQVNFTTAPDAKGGHIGYLERNVNGQTQTDELTCQSVVHTM
jgi:hypothetical protein